MTKRVLLSLLAVCAFLGILDSLYLAESAMTDTALVCDINGLSDCNVVAQSAYSHIFGIPLGVYGVVFYLMVLILTVVLVYLPKQRTYQALLGLSGAGVLASLWFLYVQFFLIEALCIYCIGSAVLTFILLVLAYLLYKRFTPQTPVVP